MITGNKISFVSRNKQLNEFNTHAGNIIGRVYMDLDLNKSNHKYASRKQNIGHGLVRYEWNNCVHKI